jgi:hypothetical protein
MKPAFTVLQRRYPKSQKRDVLFHEIGWDDLTNNPAYIDTCAIRMSIGLLGAGVTLPGARMLAKAGELKGRRIEPGQANLSGILTRLWGKPEKYKDEKAAKAGIGSRSGVVSFFRIKQLGIPTSAGHIDLTLPGLNGFQECARSCFFDAAEVWFWPLR